MTTLADIIGADGAAGNPGVLLAAGRQLEQTAVETTRLSQTLAHLEATRWNSAARYRYDHLRGSIATDDLAQLATAFDHASQATTTYGKRLEQIQSEARGIAKAIDVETTNLKRYHGHQWLTDVDATTKEIGSSVLSVVGAHGTATDLGSSAARERRVQREHVAASERRLAVLRAHGHDLNTELNVAAKAFAQALAGLLGSTGAAAPSAGAKAGTVAAVGTAVTIPAVLSAAARKAIDAKARSDWDAVPVVQGKHAIRNSLIADQARNMALTQQGKSGGQCLVFAEHMIAAAGGQPFGFGFNTGTYQAQWAGIAAPVPSLDAALPGDIIQWQSADGLHVHTAVVVTAGADPQIVDSNWDNHEHISGIVPFSSREGGWRNPPPFKIWRYGTV